MIEDETDDFFLFHGQPLDQRVKRRPPFEVGVFFVGGGFVSLRFSWPDEALAWLLPRPSGPLKCRDRSSNSRRICSAASPKNARVFSGVSCSSDRNSRSVAFCRTSPVSAQAPDGRVIFQHLRARRSRHAPAARIKSSRADLSPACRSTSHFRILSV